MATQGTGSMHGRVCVLNYHGGGVLEYCSEHGKKYVHFTSKEAGIVQQLYINEHVQFNFTQRGCTIMAEQALQPSQQMSKKLPRKRALLISSEPDTLCIPPEELGDISSQPHKLISAGGDDARSEACQRELVRLSNDMQRWRSYDTKQQEDVVAKITQQVRELDNIDGEGYNQALRKVLREAVAALAPPRGRVTGNHGADILDKETVQRVQRSAFLQKSIRTLLLKLVNLSKEFGCGRLRLWLLLEHVRRMIDGFEKHSGSVEAACSGKQWQKLKDALAAAGAELYNTPPNVLGDVSLLRDGTAPGSPMGEGMVKAGAWPSGDQVADARSSMKTLKRKAGQENIAEPVSASRPRGSTESWTRDLDQQLLGLRERNEDWNAISRKLGRSQPWLRERYLELLKNPDVPCPVISHARKSVVFVNYRALARRALQVLQGKGSSTDIFSQILKFEPEAICNLNRQRENIAGRGKKREKWMGLVSTVLSRHPEFERVRGRGRAEGIWQLVPHDSALAPLAAS